MTHRLLSELFFPAYVAAGSALVLLFQAFASYNAAKPNFNHDISTQSETGIKRHVELLGGYTIFCYRILRAIGCLLLVALTITTIFVGDAGIDSFMAMQFVVNIVALTANKADRLVSQSFQTAMLATYVSLVFLCH